MLVVVRRSVLVLGASTAEAGEAGQYWKKVINIGYEPFADDMSRLLRLMVPLLLSEGLSPADLESGRWNEEPGTRLPWPLG